MFNAWGSEAWRAYVEFLGFFEVLYCGLLLKHFDFSGFNSLDFFLSGRVVGVLLI